MEFLQIKRRSGVLRRFRFEKGIVKGRKKDNRGSNKKESKDKKNNKKNKNNFYGMMFWLGKKSSHQ